MGKLLLAYASATQPNAGAHMNIDRVREAFAGQPDDLR
jgi:hypothetical protein